jgi:hypothetical protein
VLKDDSQLPPPSTLGVYYGRVVAIRESGVGEVKGYTGPHVVLIPGRLMNGTKVGDEVRYEAVRRLGHGLAAVTRLIAMRRFR